MHKIRLALIVILLLATGIVAGCAGQPPAPTAAPTSAPAVEPTAEPTAEPVEEPTAEPTAEPVEEPTAEPTAEEAEETGDVALTIKGLVDQEVSLTLDGYLALGLIEVTAEHPKSGEQQFEGVPLQAVFDLAGVQDAATEMVITASDGFEATVVLEELGDCDNCLVGLDEDNTLRMVLPGQSSKAWVKDVVSLEFR